MTKYAEPFHSAQTQILQAAADEFTEKGFAATSYGGIALRAGTSKGLVQYHFARKVDLALALVKAAFEGEVFSPPEGLKEIRGIAAIVRSSKHVSQNLVSDPFARAAMRIIDEGPRLAPGLPVPYVGWIRQAEIFLQQAIDDEEIAPLADIPLAAWLLVAGAYGAEHVAATVGELAELPRYTFAMLRLQLMGLGVKDLDSYL